MDDDAGRRGQLQRWLAMVPDLDVEVETAPATPAACRRPDIAVAVVVLQPAEPGPLECARSLVQAEPDLGLVLLADPDLHETEAAADGLPNADVLAHAGLTARRLARAVRRGLGARATRQALRESERRLHAIADTVSIGLYRTDAAGSCTFVNPEWCRITGLAPSEAHGRGWRDAVHPEDRGRVEAVARAAVAESRSFTVEHRVLTPGNRVRWVIGRAEPVHDTEGRHVGYAGSTLDVTRSHAEIAERRQAERRFQTAFDQAPIGMLILGLDGRVEQANGSITQMLGLTLAEMRALAPFAVVHPEDLPHILEQLDGLAPGQPAPGMEHRVCGIGDRVVWVESRATLIGDAEGRPLHTLIQVVDLTDRRRYEDRLRHMAHHDPLTGLLNRRGFEEALGTHLERCLADRPHGALLVLDLDGFKVVNDTLGHSAGDELIVACSLALKERLRTDDVLARLGGDEFALLLTSGGVREATAVADVIVDTVRQVCVAPGAMAEHHRVTASVGVAVVDDAVRSGDELLVRADLAMYDAKDAGRDRVAISDEGADEPRLRTQMTWVKRIAGALQEDRFVLHAQPVLELATGRVAFHEVLVRMLDDEGELIPPGAFLGVAERFGLMGDLDRWVIDAALAAMAEARRAGRSLPLSVNVSGLSAGSSGLLEALEQRLQDGDVDPADLIVELTETAAVADIPAARTLAQGLRSLGCRFALDDFGAGYGTFYYLKHLPFDLLKIDGEYIRRALESPTDQVIIGALTQMARGLGKQTVAEFVPDDAHVDFLLRYGVDFGQGYHLGHPQPLAELVAAPVAAPV